MQNLECIKLLSSDFPASHRLDAWNGMFSNIIELSPPNGSLDFFASIKAYHLGNMIFSESAGPGFDNVRTKQMIDRNPIDSFALSITATPRIVFAANTGVVAANEALILDYTRDFKFKFLGPNTCHMTLTFDRPALTAALPNIGDLHGMQLRMGEARTRLLSRSVSIINQSLPHLSQADGPAISNLMTQLLGACLTPKSRRTDIMRLALHQARQQVAKLFIEINLPDPNLDPLSVARQCGLSRSALFELFRDSGGISHYIWMRRLQRAADDLLDPSYGHLSMGEIAEKLGFNHQAHFSLAFKRRFGMTAKEWRQSARSTGYISRSHDHSFYLAQQLKQAVGNGAVKH